MKRVEPLLKLDDPVLPYESAKPAKPFRQRAEELWDNTIAEIDGTGWYLMFGAMIFLLLALILGSVRLVLVSIVCISMLYDRSFRRSRW